MRWLAFPAAAFLLAAVALLAALAGSQSEDPDGELVASLIAQLGDEDFARRDAAAKELDKLGDKALPQLRQALHGDDAEIRWRAQLILAAPRRKSTSLGLELVLIKAGEFSMGSPENEASRNGDERAHRVLLSQPFYLGVYEVTQDEFERVMKTRPSAFSRGGHRAMDVGGKETSLFPVESVSWFDAAAFCNELSKRDGFEPYYRLEDITRRGESIVSAAVTLQGGHGYRLPTEAEWEYACRAGTLTPYHFGGGSNGALANVRGVTIAGGYGGEIRGPNLARTTTVASYNANAWGLFDMHGNVGEWCGDYYDKDYYAASPKANPPGPKKGMQRVIRGGSFLVTEASSRSACRFYLSPDESKDFVGFRVARNP